MYRLKVTFISIKNIITFLSVVIPNRVSIFKWRRFWNIVQERHQQEVRKMLTELTMDGRVKRRIENGEFVYYPIDEKE